jgi:hypothetical protein
VITDGMEQLIGLLANDTSLQFPTFRHKVMPFSQSHQVGQIQLSPIKVMMKVATTQHHQQLKRQKKTQKTQRTYTVSLLLLLLPSTYTTTQKGKNEKKRKEKKRK